MQDLAALEAGWRSDPALGERLQRLARLTARALAMPVAAVSIVDERREQFRATVGLRLTELARELSLGALVTVTGDILAIGDARHDPRLAGHPLVTGEPGIRFYAARALVAAEGRPVGALAVMDYHPRQLDGDAIETLDELGELVEHELDLLPRVGRRDLALLSRSTSALRVGEVVPAELGELVARGDELGELAQEFCAMADAVQGRELRLKHANLETIQRLVIAAEYKDRATGGHIRRMSRLSGLLSEHLALSADEVSVVRIASPMHDVGKLGVPDSILLKPSGLTDCEWRVVERHCVIGAGILGGSDNPLLQAGEIVALSHHEKWDGTGYPNGLAGEDIPLLGRICAVADVFDALTSERPYKLAYPVEVAVDTLAAEREKHFDPGILDLFLDHLDEMLAAA